MCLDEDRGLIHSCVPECQACYVFTLDNLRLIAEVGASVSLGTLTDLVPIAQQGCNFCKFLINVALLSGKPWAEGASAEITPVESYKRNASLSSGQIDKIRIHFRDPFNFGSSSTGRYQEHTFHQYSIDLGIHSATPELREIIPRTPASPQVATPEVFQEIETWINDCLEDHVECPKNVNTLLPTRVLDVFSNTSSEGVSLHISSSGECGRYTALSYCWGAGTQTRTLWENLKQHTQSLRVAGLPQTIQDAIRVTRALKIQYLWVDALCIIQDSLDDDWPREAGRMPEIYKNAVVTISAAAAVDSNHGFLEDRQSILLAQAQSSRFPVYKLMSDDEESGDVATLENIGEVFVTQDEELGYNTKEFDDEHINTRAWTLQETWLSPRLLCFGSGLPKWICLQHERAYGVDETKSRSSWNKRDMVRSQIFTARSLSSENTDIIPIHDQLGRTEYLREWWSLFIDYSRRKLTVKTDKMVAISGIAKEFGLLLNDQYVAGLWKSSLPHSLLWRHENQPHEEDARKERRRKRDRFIAFFASNTSTKEPYIAPSWSPFANNSSVYMSYPSSDSGQTLCVINELRVEPANAFAPFHGVKPGYAWIEVTAPMTHMSYEEIITHFVVVTDGSPHIYWDWILPDGGAANKYLGPAGKLQMEHPQLNPQVLTDIRTTLTLGGDPPLVRESSQRPTPPSKTADPWPQLTDKKKHARGVPDADFWLLEIGHTTVPTGLVLVQLAAGRFKRIGMFRMGRNQSPNWQWVNGYEISGPRRWDWDTRLEMRKCIIT